MWCANVRLSNISFSLHEEQTLIKTGGRLHRNLDDGDFSKVLNEEIYRLGAPKVTDDMVNALDPSDIRKGHARRMECLCRIHNGSEQELGDGYLLCKAVASDVERRQVIPLYCEEYSKDAECFTSEHDQ